MRRTDKPWDQGGKFFPKSAYYGVWMRLDRTYSTRNPNKSHGGWWNVFQFKSDDESGESQPVWVLKHRQSPSNRQNAFLSLYENITVRNLSLRKTRYRFPLIAGFTSKPYTSQSTSNTADGSLSVLARRKIDFERKQCQNRISRKNQMGRGWGTTRITLLGVKNPALRAFFFDDATISTKPTHIYVDKMLKLQR